MSKFDALFHAHWTIMPPLSTLLTFVIYQKVVYAVIKNTLFSYSQCNGLKSISCCRTGWWWSSCDGNRPRGKTGLEGAKGKIASSVVWESLAGSHLLAAAVGAQQTLGQSSSSSICLWPWPLSSVSIWPWPAPLCWKRTSSIGPWHHIKSRLDKLKTTNSGEMPSLNLLWELCHGVYPGLAFLLLFVINKYYILGW